MAPCTWRSVIGSSKACGAGVDPTMCRAHAAWRASTVSRPNSAATSPLSWTCGVTPASSATVRSSIATAVFVNAASRLVGLAEVEDGPALGLGPEHLLDDLHVRALVRAEGARPPRFAADIEAIVPISSACV